MSLPSAAPFRVLSLDGGGMRGLYTAVVLDELAKCFAGRRPGPPHDLDVGKGFDLIVGTSTGGLIACGLAAGLGTHDLVQLYERTGPQIFADPMPRGQVAAGLWVGRHWRSAANNPLPLRQALVRWFKKATLADVYRERHIALAIPSVRFSLQESFVFATPHFLDRNRGNYRLVDVCLATSAAPMYFPIAFVTNAGGNPRPSCAFVDGGLWANNPIIVALEEALDLATADQPIEIISMTTCAQPTNNPVLPADASWGVWDWRAGGRALSVALDAQSSRYTGIVKALTDHLRSPCDVLRLEGTSAGPEFNQYMGLDQSSEETISALHELGEHDARVFYHEACKMKRASTTRPAEGGRANRRWNNFGMLYDIFDAMPSLDHSKSGSRSDS
jgi:predicted acylesterase/phospholipase RssA